VSREPACMCEWWLARLLLSCCSAAMRKADCIKQLLLSYLDLLKIFLAFARSGMLSLLDDSKTVRYSHLFGLQVGCIVVDARVEFLPRRKWMEAAPHLGGCWRWCCCQVVKGGVVLQCRVWALGRRHDGCSSKTAPKVCDSTKFRATIGGSGC
jgi:hypothetical protein